MTAEEIAERIRTAPPDSTKMFQGRMDSWKDPVDRDRPIPPGRPLGRDNRYDAMPISEEGPAVPLEPDVDRCAVCAAPLALYVCARIKDGSRYHVRCLDWTGRPFPSAAHLQRVREAWPSIAQATRAAILDPCQAWARLERGWPPDPLTGEAVEAVVVAAAKLRAQIAEAQREDTRTPSR